jgi:NADPH-dependent glutamate synthase beta subunit-like oxidoreductase
MISIRLNGVDVKTDQDNILQAALQNNIYIPHLCAHSDIPPSENCQASDKIYQFTELHLNQPGETKPGCELCLVKIGGDNNLRRACATKIKEGMIVETESSELSQIRKDHLSKILTNHPHACLTCVQHEGCSLTQCSSNVSVAERCCPKFGRCELQKVSEYIGIKQETPRYKPLNNDYLDNDPLIKRNYSLCIGCTRCVRACRDLRGIDALGYVIENNKVIVGCRLPSLKDSGCKFCGACIEVCPTGALTDRDLKLVERKHDLIPCQFACPAQINIPEYIRQIEIGAQEKALEVIREDTPLPTVLGKVCFHPCEEVCRRGKINEPISICALKRFACETNLPNRNRFTVLHPDKPVAIIGAGPAGLTTAYYLSKIGYPVTIFESQKEAGGMMRYAIPNYRLPIESLNNDLKQILTENVTLKLNQALGKDFNIQSLLKEGFKAIFISIGAQLPKLLQIKELPKKIKNDSNILWGIDFLKSIRSGKPFSIGKSVAVIGGGNVAIDIALTAKRLGAGTINLICLESADEMPAHDWEIEQAKEENIILNCSWGPDEIIYDVSGKTKGIKFIKCLSVFDEKKCFNPSFDKTSSSIIDADTIIIAIGQKLDASALQSSEIELTNIGNIKTNEATLETNQKGVFAGGEATHNPSSIVNAIADAKKAAISIDKFLGGSGDLDIKHPILLKHNFGHDETFAEKKREIMPKIRVSERLNNSNEVELGYKKEQAMKEASRCLQCDMRFYISPPVFPPQKEKYLTFSVENINLLPEKEGVYQLLDESKNIISIKGVSNLSESLKEQISTKSKACYFMFELDPFYTKRESELIQQYLARYGKMPASNDELSDLF